MTKPINISLPDFDTAVIDDIIGQLTPEQKECIVSLKEEWSDSGYKIFQADILVATDSRTFPDRFDQLIDSHLRISKSGFKTRHRLLPLGMAVKQRLDGA